MSPDINKNSIDPVNQQKKGTLFKYFKVQNHQAKRNYSIKRKDKILQDHSSIASESCSKNDNEID